MVWYWDPYFTDMDLGTDPMVHAPCVQKSFLWARDNQHSTHYATWLPCQKEETWRHVGWVIWHLRENPSPEESTMFKISMANLHMVIKRRIQDKYI